MSPGPSTTQTVRTVRSRSTPTILPPEAQRQGSSQGSIKRLVASGPNGFRIDQAFVNAALPARLKDAVYVCDGAATGRRRDRLSDHAALVVDLVDA